MIFRQNLESMLTNLEKKQSFVNRELSQCPQGHLMQSAGKQRQMFFQVTYAHGKRIRRSIGSQPQMIAALARKKYLETEREFLERNIQVIKSALLHFEPVSADSIVKTLPPQYRNLPEAYFFAGAGEEDAQDAWSRAEFRQSAYMPERKVHLTSRGLAVRSKSEVMIVEMLYALHVPFRYEQVLPIGKYEVSPDFTLRRASDGKLFYWEHCGLTGNEKYMRHHKWKMDLYESAGIVPWSNLIVTYDDENGNINMAIVENEIKHKLLV